MHSILPFEENQALRTVSKEIPFRDILTPKITKLIQEMKALLAKEEYGVALAAVQVGEPIRLFIVSGRAIARGKRNAPDETAPTKKIIHKKAAASADMVYINPVCIKLSHGRTDKHEGCLSIRGKWGEVPRAEKATIKYLDERGKQQERGASGFLAHIFQHEMDHLEGVLYVDKADKLYDEHEKKE